MEQPVVVIPKEENVSTSSLSVDGKNPNVMVRKDLELLKESFRKWGMIFPIVTNKDLLIADGEQKWIAAQELQMPEVKIIRLPVAEVDRKMLRQVLNKLHGEHDFLKDALEFDLIIQMGGQETLQHMLSLNDSKLQRYMLEIHPTGVEVFDVPEIEKVHTEIQPGDLIELGKHRVLCGDATNPEDLKRLMHGYEVMMLFTDPPYGVAFDKHNFDDRNFKKNPAKSNSAKGFKNWGMLKGDESLDTYLKFLEAITPLLKPKSWYLCTASRYLPQVMGKLTELGVYFATPIVWVKENFVLSWERYKAQHENIIFCGEGAHPTGKASIWFGKNNESTVWQIHRDNMTASAAKHPTQKPVELIQKAVLNSSQPGDVVADFFGGSGSTLIACEQLGRTALLLELDARYCEVICQRWEAFTKQTRMVNKNPKISENNV